VCEKVVKVSTPNRIRSWELVEDFVTHGKSKRLRIIPAVGGWLGAYLEHQDAIGAGDLADLERLAQRDVPDGRRRHHTSKNGKEDDQDEDAGGTHVVSPGGTRR